MAEQSRQRLFPSKLELEEPGEVCGLCGKTSVRYTSKYPTWKNKLSQQCVQSLGVDTHSPICRACRDDVSRLVKNPAFTPRWEKEKQNEKCIIRSCKSKELHHSNTIMGEELIELGFEIPNIIPTPSPICKHHYYVATEEKPGPPNISYETKCNEKVLDQVAEHINTSFHTQIRKYLQEDTSVPFQFDQLNIDAFISDMDPTIWYFICKLTQSISESKGESKVYDTASSTYHVKKLCRFTCTCILMYCIDDRCYLPLHNIITDMVDSCGGSTKLIRSLNRLGMCSSLLTLCQESSSNK